MKTDIPYFVTSDLEGASVRARSFRSSATSLGFNTRSGGRARRLPEHRACAMPARTLSPMRIRSCLAMVPSREITTPLKGAAGIQVRFSETLGAHLVRSRALKILQRGECSFARPHKHHFFASSIAALGMCSFLNPRSSASDVNGPASVTCSDFVTSTAESYESHQLRALTNTFFSLNVYGEFPPAIPPLIALEN